ncbi:MAG: FliM/FliN family flagellar motor switch protein [Gemmatimonadota bacterium]
MAKRASVNPNAVAPVPVPVPAPAPPSPEALDALPVTLTIELGRARIALDHALGIGEQSLIELDKAVGEPVDVLLNGRPFARAEVVTVGEYFGVRLTEIVRPA